MRILRTASVVFTIGVGLVGCIVDYCPDSERYVDGRCQPVLAEDAGVDAGEADAFVADAPDGGPCGGACEGATPLCDETTGTCVACLTNLDCTEPSAPRCDAGACAACAGDLDCEAFADTPVCDEGAGRCVACTGDTEAARCGPFSCRRSDGTCTETLRGTLDVCVACEADSECAAERRCVRHVFMGTDLGAFCFLDASRGGCGDTDAARRPYRTRTDATSVDGEAGAYCFPPVSTTCAGIRDTQSVACATDEECGAPGLDDAHCPLIGTGAGACSYECGGAFDCRSTLSCGGIPAHCQP